MKKSIYLITLFSILPLLAADPRLRPQNWARPVMSDNLKNWYKLDDKVYRSAQPSSDGFKELEKFGIKNVLNLRDKHTDQNKALGAPLNFFAVKMEADEIKKENVIEALKVIKKSDGPILVHCWHGSDRTGVICALYRILFQNWSKKDALDELANGGYGYHDFYSNIPLFIEQVNIDEMKKAVFGAKG